MNTVPRSAPHEHPPVGATRRAYHAASLLARPARTGVSRLVREQVYSLLKRSGVPEDCVCHVERLVTMPALDKAASHAPGRFSVPSRDTEESATRFVVAALNASIANGRPR